MDIYSKAKSRCKYKEGRELNIETREQTLAKIEFLLPTLTDAQLRMVSGFIRGIKKGEGIA